MNDQEIQLEIQAFVDGELTEARQSEIASLAARNPGVNDLIKELKQTRQALGAYDEAVELPETREFYWSKIQRQIESLPVVREESRRPSLFSGWARWLAPAACLAAMGVASWVFLGESRVQDGSVKWQAAYDGVNAFTYRDYNEGMTVLWLSYPGDNAVANSEEAATMN